MRFIQKVIGIYAKNSNMIWFNFPIKLCFDFKAARYLIELCLFVCFFNRKIYQFKF